jgi:Ca2+/Na+ antiporter
MNIPSIIVTSVVFLVLVAVLRFFVYMDKETIMVSKYRNHDRNKFLRKLNQWFYWSVVYGVVASTVPAVTDLGWWTILYLLVFATLFCFIFFRRLIEIEEGMAVTLDNTPLMVKPTQPTS